MDDSDYSIDELNITFNESDEEALPNFSGYSTYEMSTYQGERL